MINSFVPDYYENLAGLMQPRIQISWTQVDDRSPEERRTRLKKADSIRRMLAESQANQPILSELTNKIKHKRCWYLHKVNISGKIFKTCQMSRTRGRTRGDGDRGPTTKRADARAQSGGDHLNFAKLWARSEMSVVEGAGATSDGEKPSCCRTRKGVNK